MFAEYSTEQMQNRGYSEQVNRFFLTFTNLSDGKHAFQIISSTKSFTVMAGCLFVYRARAKLLKTYS